MGTPRSARPVSPAFIAASAFAASSRARFAQTVRKALSFGLCLSIRSRQSRVASAEEISPARIAAAISVALMMLVPVMVVSLGFESSAGESARIPGASRAPDLDVREVGTRRSTFCETPVLEEQGAATPWPVPNRQPADGRASSLRAPDARGPDRPGVAWSYQCRFRALVSTSYPSRVMSTLSSKSPT